MKTVKWIMKTHIHFFICHRRQKKENECSKLFHFPFTFRTHMRINGRYTDQRSKVHNKQSESRKLRNNNAALTELN